MFSLKLVMFCFRTRKWMTELDLLNLQLGAIGSSGIIIMKNTFIINKSNSFRHHNIVDAAVLRIFLEMKRINNLNFVRLVLQKVIECSTGESCCGWLEVHSEDILSENILGDVFGPDFHSSSIRRVSVGLWHEGGETDNVRFSLLQLIVPVTKDVPQ